MLPVMWVVALNHNSILNGHLTKPLCHTKCDVRSTHMLSASQYAYAESSYFDRESSHMSQPPTEQVKLSNTNDVVETLVINLSADSCQGQLTFGTA